MMAHGRKGALLSRQEKLANRVLNHRGGVKAIKPDVDDMDVDDDESEKPGRRKNRKRGVRNNKLKQEIARLKASAASKGSQGRARGRGGGGRRGGGRGSGRGGDGDGADVSKQYCFSFSKGFGPCASCAPGSVCKRSGRIYACHICGGAHKAKDCKQKAKKEKKEEGEG